jgi:hypothetical protein
MKKLIIGALVLLLMACQDSPDAAKEIVNKLEPSVGEKIQTDMGLRWIANYKKNNSSAREGQLFKISKANLKKLMKNSEAVGISFHHALDENGIPHILALSINKTLNLWSTDESIIDANENNEIDFSLARTWTENYKTANPEEIQYHSFGLDIFKEISKRNEFEIVRAVNDDQIPQLLLIVRNNTEAGRVNNSTVEIYDASQRCPPLCAQ